MSGQQIYAEFGQVVVVGVGFLTAVDEAWQLRVKAYSGSDEKQLLEEVAGLLRTREIGSFAHIMERSLIFRICAEECS